MKLFIILVNLIFFCSPCILFNGCSTFIINKKVTKPKKVDPATQHLLNRIKLFKNQNVQLAAKKNETQIVMLGDSITQGFNLVKAFPGKPFVNRGISSDHTDWPGPWGAVKRLTPKLLAPRPSHIFILLGINDVGTSVDKSIAGYRKILEILKKTYPKAKIYVQSVLPTRGRYARLNVLVLDYNTKLKALVDEFKVNYVDLHSLYTDEAGALKAEVTGDGLHLKADAYEPWAQEIEKVLGQQ